MLGAAKTTQKKALRQVAALIEVTTLFLQNHISYLCIKGVVLSQQLYGDVGYREAADIDLLIEKTQFTKTYHLLVQQGWLPLDSFMPTNKNIDLIQKHCKEISFFHPRLKVHLELHLFLHENPFLFNYTFHQLWKDRQTVTIDQHQFDTLSNQHNLLYLCLHAASHAWNRAQWVEDIQLFIKNNEFNWDAISKQAEHQHVLKHLVVSIYLAEIEKIPKQISEHHNVCQNIIKQARKLMKQERPSKTVLHLELCDSAKIKLGQLYTYVSPNAKTWLKYNFPPRLFWILFLTKPLLYPYLLLKRAWRK